jgi:hypothetical protein
MLGLPPRAVSLPVGVVVDFLSLQRRSSLGDGEDRGTTSEEVAAALRLVQEGKAYEVEVASSGEVEAVPWWIPRAASLRRRPHPTGTEGRKRRLRSGREGAENGWHVSVIHFCIMRAPRRRMGVTYECLVGDVLYCYNSL